VAHDSDITGRTPRRYPFSRNRLDPDPQYAELRRTAPVCRVQLPYGPPAWLVTGYHLTRSVFGDARFSRAATIGRDNPRECAVEFGQVAESVMSMDPPAHTRIRQLAGRAFTVRRVERLRPRAQQIASGLIEDMVASGAPADLVESFSFAFPAIIICELLGIPAADRHAFRGWTDAIVSTATSTPEQAQDTYLHLAGYLAGLFAQRRAQPGDDLLTWLVQARDNDDRLTETELLFLGMALLVGGYETTAHQITNMVYTLLTHDRQLRQLKARPELLPDAVEEMLRFIVFGSALNPRIATADVKLSEVVVRAGEPVLCSRSSANRDERVFPRAGELDITRDPNPHVAFGQGTHFCVGANLARLELRLLFRALTRQWTNLRVLTPPDIEPNIFAGAVRTFDLAFELR